MERAREGRLTPKYSLKELRARHKMILRHTASGATRQEVADALGITTATVTNVVNCELGRKTMAEIQERIDEVSTEMHGRIIEFVPNAMRLLERIIDGDDGLAASIALRARTAENYVARAGFGAIQKSHIISQNLSKDELDGLKARGLESAKRFGMLADK